MLRPTPSLRTWKRRERKEVPAWKPLQGRHQAPASTKGRLQGTQHRRRENQSGHTWQPTTPGVPGCSDKGVLMAGCSGSHLPRTTSPAKSHGSLPASAPLPSPNCVPVSNRGPNIDKTIFIANRKEHTHTLCPTLKSWGE